MPYGLNILNIDENFKTLRKYRVETLRFNNYKATLQNVSSTDVIVLEYSSSQVAFVTNTKGVVEFISNEQSATAKIALFTSDISVNKVEEYGLRVYNSVGKLAFSSDWEFLRIKDTVFANNEKGSFSVPNSKNSGVILQSSISKIIVGYDYSEYTYRSVMVSTNGISFNFIQHRFQSLNKVNMTFIPRDIFTPFLITKL